MILFHSNEFLIKFSFLHLLMFLQFLLPLFGLWTVIHSTSTHAQTTANKLAIWHTFSIMLITFKQRHRKTKSIRFIGLTKYWEYSNLKAVKSRLELTLLHPTLENCTTPNPGPLSSCNKTMQYKHSIKYNNNIQPYWMLNLNLLVWWI